MSVIEIVCVAIAAAAILVSGVVTIVLQLKKGQISDAMNSAQGLFDTLLGIKNRMEEAEGFENWTGKEKLNYVLTNSKLDALDGGWNYDAETAEKFVNMLIDFSKTVNARGVDSVRVEEVEK